MTQILYSNINGSIHLSAESALKSSDESTRQRYGLYETMLYRDGQLELAKLHWERLWKGLELLNFQIPHFYSPVFFERQIDELLIKNELKELVRIRIQFFSEKSQEPFIPFYFIEIQNLNPSILEWDKEGLRLEILPQFKKQMIAISNYKISHSLHYPLAKAAIRKLACDDVLLLNSENRLIESSIANVFWIKSGVIYTPPLSEGCLAGTMRNWIIEQLKNKQIQVIEKPLPYDVLMDADEVFLTNGIRFIRGVNQIAGQSYCFSKTKILHQLLS